MRHLPKRRLRGNNRLRPSACEHHVRGREAVQLPVRYREAPAGATAATAPWSAESQRAYPAPSHDDVGLSSRISSPVAGAMACCWPRSPGLGVGDQRPGWLGTHHLCATIGRGVVHHDDLAADRVRRLNAGRQRPAAHACSTTMAIDARRASSTVTARSMRYGQLGGGASRTAPGAVVGGDQTRAQLRVESTGR